MNSNRRNTAAPLVLMGLSHAGKTTVGKLLAARLHGLFFDTDSILTQRTGCTPRQLCRRHGLAALHAAEAAALSECARLRHGACGTAPNRPAHDAEAQPVIIATGGGICDNQQAAGALAALPQRIFLYAEEAALFSRLTKDALATGFYPAFLGFLPVAQQAEASERFAVLYAHRTARYRALCTACIDTRGLNCELIADRLFAALTDDARL